MLFIAFYALTHTYKIVMLPERGRQHRGGGYGIGDEVSSAGRVESIGRVYQSLIAGRISSSWGTLYHIFIYIKQSH
jgi:hypothetical protein